MKDFYQYIESERFSLKYWAFVALDPLLYCCLATKKYIFLTKFGKVIHVLSSCIITLVFGLSVYRPKLQA